MFWDSTALIPILVPEARSAALGARLRADREVVLWWATPAECQSALHRSARDRLLPAPLLAAALERLAALEEDADVVAPSTRVRARAGRLLAAYPLAAAAALQLAAALVWCDETPRGDHFVCLDAGLRDAARREGFLVLPP
jgi:hypothetical protein